MATTSPKTREAQEAHWFIGMGPRGPFTTSATQTTINGWVVDGYAHAGHEGMAVAHRSDACEWRPTSHTP